MVTPPKSARKTITFGSSDSDQALLDAISTELQYKQYASFSHLCKIALHHFLLSREPTQSVVLFMELERQIAELQHKVTQLEATGSVTHLRRLEALEMQLAHLTQSGPRPIEIVTNHPDENGPDKNKNTESAQPASPVDPLLARLGPLLEDF